MAKKSKKRTQHEEAVTAEAIAAATVLAVEEPGTSEAQAAPDEPAAQTAKTRSSRPARKQAKVKATAAAAKQTTKPRAERESVLDLEPADEIKPVRAGTQLADVLALTARPAGATAVELDKAIVSTAKSVKHYGLGALRYPLHKNKGYGFRTVLTDGEPARYHLVLPKGAELASPVAKHAGQAKKRSSKPVAAKAKGAKKAKGHGKQAASARA